MNLTLFRYLPALLLLPVLALVYGCTEETYVTPEVSGSISGRVLTQDTKQPLGGVVVRISPSAVAVETDQQGYFKADSIPAGSYSLISSLEKYRNDVTTAAVQGNKNIDVTIYLVPDAKQNNPPSGPAALRPAHQSTGAEVSRLVLGWSSSDADKDTLKYDVILFKEGETSGTVIASSIPSDSLVVSGLSYGTTYYWQVVVSDSYNSPVKSEVWTFRTKPFPELPYYFSRKAESGYQVYASDGTEEVRLTSGSNNWRPVISPQRNRLAFISNRESDSHIYVSDIDGRNTVKLTTIPIATIVPATEVSFCWSPDGTQIVYPSYDKLYAVRADGTGLRVISRAPIGRFFASADWTSQGNRIVARLTGTSIYENDIILIDPEIGLSTPVISDLKGKTGNPLFSLDGRKILYTLDADNFQNSEGRQLNSRILLYDLASGAAEDLSGEKTAGTNDLDPRFSSTGGRIIFTNTGNDGFSVPDIYTLDIATQNRSLLLPDAQMPYWR